MNRYIIVACLFVMTIYCKAESNIASEKKYFRTRADAETFYRRAARNYYDFHIEGTVVDPNGQPIPDVKVKLSKYKDSMNDAFNRKYEIIKDGTFSYSSPGCYAWSLNFEKQGYYENGTGFVFAFLGKMLSSGDAVLKGRTIFRKVKIVLYPYGDLNRDLLTVDDKILTYSEDGENKKIVGVVVPYEDKGERRRKEEEFQFSFTDEKKLPKN